MSKGRGGAIAKLTRPDVAGLLSRRRLMALLDAGARQTVTWVGAPAGSGKTSLVSSYLAARGLPCLWYQVDEGDADVATFFYYLGLAAKAAAPGSRRPLPLLTPEYLQGLGTFTRRYFEALCARLGRPHAIVLDNYQEVAEGARFHEVVRDALQAIPEGVRVFVLSRGPPPAALARQQASGAVAQVRWEDLRFTPGEVGAFAVERGRGGLSEAALRVLHERTEGWAAGLVLMLARLGLGEPGAATLARATPEEVFDFFAGELFEKSDAETQSFLLSSAPLPTMTAATAAELTGNPRAGRILAELSRRQFFTMTLPAEEPVFRYHPLFREFLVARGAATLTAERLAALRRDAAALLERTGEVESAAELLAASGDLDGLARLVQASAPALLAQGRTQTVSGWLRAFPPERVAASPWLEYWGGACALSADPVESRRRFERAFALFEAAGARDGLFLSWAGAMEAILLGWGDFADADRWVALLERLLAGEGEPPAPAVAARVTISMLFGLTLRRPEHPGIGAWAERARVLASEATDPRVRSFVNVYLELYYLWIGDHAGAELVLRGVRASIALPEASPLARVLGRIVEAVYCVRMAEHAACRRAVLEGLEAATSSGVVIWNSQLYSQGALNALSEGDRAEAGRYLEQMGLSYRPSRRIDACMFHYSSAWHAFLGGELARALEHAGTALRFALAAGTPFHEALSRHGLAQVLAERGEPEAAAEHLARAREIGVAMRSRILLFMVDLGEADLALRAGAEEAGLARLAAALALGREQGYVNFYWWRPEVMARLAARALEAGLETAYVRRLVRVRRLVPPSAAGERWPWPLAIRTLGGFELRRDGEPVAFPRKVQQKPLALLKVLVALGGRDVPEDRLADALWPDVEGDLARRSLETCLHRVRKLSGHEDVVRVRGRRVSLDDRSCWVDLWALEDAAARPDGASRAAEAALRRCEEALALYRGRFLPEEDGAPWTAAGRERARRSFRRAVLDAVGVHARAQEWDGAAALLRRALEREGRAVPPPSPVGAREGGDAAAAEAEVRRLSALLGEAPGG